MNIGQALKFVRTALGLTQKQVETEYIDSTAYSRIERGKRSIRLNDLQDMLKIMGVHSLEFLSLIHFESDSDEIRELFNYCSNHQEDSISKEQLLQHYYRIEKDQEVSLREFSHYIGIKNMFHQYWSEVGPVNGSDIDQAYHLLKEKTYYFRDDYVLLSNIVRFFSKDQGNRIIAKAFPLQHAHRRDNETKKFAYHSLLNWITARIHERDYTGAKEAIDIAQLQKEFLYSYYFRLNLQYLSDLLNYLKTGKHVYYEKIVNFIHILENIGHIRHAQAVSQELELLTHGADKSKNEETVSLMWCDLEK